MSRRYPGLRSTLTAAMLTIVTIAVSVSILLMVLTTHLHSASRVLAEAVESVNLANAAEVDLLLHGRTKDAIQWRGLESDLRRTLVSMSRFVTTPAESRALHDVSERVERYFVASHEEGNAPDVVEARLGAAYEAVDALVDVNIAQAREARQRVSRWDDLATGVGLVTALSLLLLSALFVWWLRARAFHPVFSLLDSMERFGRGNRDARAEEAGPSELHELAKRFNEMASALTAQREVQMSFLGGVAHDLRNPLATLNLTVAAVRRDVKTEPEVRLARLEAQAERQVARMDRMLGDLLDTVRIESGKLELKVSWHDVRALVREVTSSFEATSPKHEMVVSVPENEVWVPCDPLRIEQVLGNLISNAIKFSPGGGQVVVSLAQKDGEAVLSVADSGIGINDEDRRRLFEPFRRVGPSKDVIPGVGLGLFVAREIVAGHGGRIEVTSMPDRGTEFQVRLPAGTSDQFGPELGIRPAGATSGERRPH